MYHWVLQVRITGTDHRSFKLHWFKFVSSSQLNRWARKTGEPRRTYELELSNHAANMGVIP